MDTESKQLQGERPTEGGGRREPRRPGDGKLCYTVPEAAELLGFSRNFGYELARTGQIPIMRFGKRMLVPKAAFDKMLGIISESEDKS